MPAARGGVSSLLSAGLPAARGAHERGPKGHACTGFKSLDSLWTPIGSLKYNKLSNAVSATKRSGLCSGHFESMRVVFDLDYFGRESIVVRVRRGILISKLLRRLRKLLCISPSDCLYLFHDGVPISQHLLTNSSLELKVTGESTFGSDEVDNWHDGFPSSEVQKHVVTCSYLNSDGHSAEKMMAIELETDNDRDVMITECNFTASDHSRLTDNLGDWASIVSCDDVSYSNGKRVIPIGGRKVSGYGTAVVTKDRNCMRLYENLDGPDERKFEVLALDVKLSEKCREGRIVVYRSPSMKCKHEISQFYDRVERYLQHMKNSGLFQCLTYVGDPNKHSSSLAAKLERKLMANFGLRNMIGSQNTRSRGECETQPDSCYAWFDPACVIVSATVNGKIHRKMDHRLIRVSYLLAGVKPEFRSFYEFEREVRDKSISDDDVRSRLNGEIGAWVDKYAAFVFKNPRQEQQSWKDFEKCDNLKLSPVIVDTAVDEMYRLVGRIQKWMSKSIKLKYPKTIPKTANAQEVKIGVLSALLGEMSALIINNPTDCQWREKFDRIEAERVDLLKVVAREHLESKMKFLVDGVRRCSKDFFKITGKMMARDKFSTACKSNISPEQKQKKLDENDKTFTNDTPGFGDDILDFENITPDRQFTVRGWRPDSENHPIADALRVMKMNKSEYIFKIFRYDFELAIYMILRMMEFADYFPQKMRTSRLTFLDSGRAIFGLDALTKVTEMVLSSEWNQCLREHYGIHGDPKQMAYEPNRGTTSCNVITFSLCDIVLSQTGQPVGQTFADLIKAFNMANRSEMLRRVQKICGAGRLCWSRFNGRVYTFEDEVRGQRFNRGVDPGSPISVFLFKLFMNTDVSLTSLSESLLWAAGYSDDRAPIFSTEDYANGDAQKAWDKSSKWAENMNVKYHTDPADAKRHTYLAYKKKGMSVPSSFQELKLGSTFFEQQSSMRELGLNICTDKSIPGARALIDKWGYVFRPELPRMKATAYRLQDIKYDFPPTFLRQMVMSYFAGVIRYSACLYWTRCIQSEMNTLRFYYGMAVASILRMNACEVFGLSVCKAASVMDNNPDYLKLLEITGLPTIRDMALTDAVSAVRQTSELFPQFFKVDGRAIESSSGKLSLYFGSDNRRSTRIRHRTEQLGTVSWEVKSSDQSSAVKDAGLPSELSDEVVRSEAVIGDIWRLAVEKVKQKLVPSGYRIPKYEQLFEISKRYCCQIELMDSENIRFRRVAAYYKTLCLNEFNVAEVLERRLAFRTPTKKLVPDLQCRVAPPVWESRRDIIARTFFGCHKDPPVTCATDLSHPVCVICGFSIIPRETASGVTMYDSANCLKCKRRAHRDCSFNLFMTKKSFVCNKVTRHLGVNGSELMGPVVTSNSAPPPRRKDMCLVCGSESENADDDWIMCVMRCGFGVHAKCLKVLCRIKGCSVVNSSEFQCSMVCYQMKPWEVEIGLHCNGGTWKSFRAGVIKREKVLTSRYQKRQRRWLNDEVECEFCGRWYGVNELRHNAAYCSAASGDPITRENLPYPFAHIKRFKHLTLKVP